MKALGILNGLLFAFGASITDVTPPVSDDVPTSLGLTVPPLGLNIAPVALSMKLPIPLPTPPRPPSSNLANIG